MKYILLLLITSPIFSFGQNEKALEHYGEAVKFFYQEAYESSIEYFDKAIEADSEFQFAYFNRGLAYEFIKEYEKAIKDFTIVLKIDSQYVDAFVHRSNSYIKVGEYEKAIGDLYRLISFNPNVSEPYKSLGLCYYYTRQYLLANDSYEIYLAANPKDVSTWFQKGLSNYYYSDYEQGIADFTEVFLLNENYLTALEWRGQCFQKSNNIRKACLDWNLAIEKGLESSKTFSKKYCSDNQ